MPDMATTQELPITEPMARWLATSSGWSGTAQILILVAALGLLLFNGFFLSFLAGSPPLLVILLVGDALAVLGIVMGWRLLRVKQAELQTELRQGVFLRSTGQVSIEYVGDTDSSRYKLEVLGYTLRLQEGLGARLLALFKRHPEAFTSELGSSLARRTTVTLPRATVDHTRGSDVFLAVYDSAGELLYRVWL